MFFIVGSDLVSIPKIPQYCQRQRKEQFAQNSNAIDSIQTIVDGDPSGISSSCVINFTVNGGATKLHVRCCWNMTTVPVQLDILSEKRCTVTSWISINDAGLFEWTVRLAKLNKQMKKTQSKTFSKRASVFVLSLLRRSASHHKGLLTSSSVFYILVYLWDL